MSIFGGDAALMDGLAAFCDEGSREDIKAFFAAHKLPDSARPLTQTFERITSCMDLKTRQTGAVSDWLANQEHRRPRGGRVRRDEERIGEEPDEEPEKAPTHPASRLADAEQQQQQTGEELEGSPLAARQVTPDLAVVQRHGDRGVDGRSSFERPNAPPEGGQSERQRCGKRAREP